MKVKIKETIIKTYNIVKADCYIFARYWDGSIVNSVEEDDETTPSIPCYEKEYDAWHIIIDLDKGQIINWEVGNTANVYYKSVDENTIKFIDENDNIIKTYEGYVPKFLDSSKEGYGDYVILEIDENGFIKDFNDDLTDIFEL